MYCKYCGNLLPEGASFCSECGAPVKKKKESSVLNFIKQIGKCVCYYLLFCGVQGIVLLTYTIATSISAVLSLDLSVGFDELYKTLLHYIGKYINEAMIVSAILTVFIVFIFFIARRKNFCYEISLNKIPVKVCILAFLIGVFAQIATVGIIGVLEPYLPESAVNSQEEAYNLLEQGSLLSRILDVAVFTPIVEEVIFRGLIFTRIRKAAPAWLAIALSAIIFGIAHGTLIAFFYAGALGAVIALLFERYNSILPGILVHAGFNGMSYLVDYLYPKNNMLFMTVLFVAAAMLVAAMFLALRKDSPMIIEEN